MRWARGPLPRLARLAAAYQSLPDPLGQGGKCPSAVGCAQGTGEETAQPGWQGQGFCLIFAASLPRSWHHSSVIIAGGF